MFRTTDKFCVTFSRYFVTVNDLQTKQNYNFGTSETICKADFKTKINDLLSRVSNPGPLFLIFHDNNQDIKQGSSFYDLRRFDLSR
jgi:hypothetical protein